MTDKPNDGGPAFPFSIHPEHGYGPGESINQGMSLREYYAGQAMAGLLASDDVTTPDHDWIAGQAVEQADALIAELNK